MGKMNSKTALGHLRDLAKGGHINIKKSPGVKGADGYSVEYPRDASGKILYPPETVRPTIDALLAESYLVQNEEGSFLPNYNVILENFIQEDRSIDFGQFVDERVGKRGQKFVFQTDSIVSSKNKETNSTADDVNGATRKKVLREKSFIITNEFGTETTEVNLRDIDSDIVAFDLLASDMEQHNRMNLLSKNRFILGMFLESLRRIDTAITFNETADDLDAEYIKLGKGLYPHLKNEIQNAKETMTKYNPGGFSKKDMFIIASPKAARALVDYQTQLPSSDKAFQTAAEGELYNYAIEGVPVYESNLLKGGQSLTITNAAGNDQVEFNNDDNIEIILGFNNFGKYAKAEPYIQSSPLIINRQEVPHIVGQFTENMHNGLMIIDDLFVGISFERTSTPDVTIEAPTVEEGGVVPLADGGVLTLTVDTKGQAITASEVSVDSGAVDPTTLVDGENTLTITGVAASTPVVVSYSITTEGGTTTGTAEFTTSEVIDYEEPTLTVGTQTVEDDLMGGTFTVTIDTKGAPIISSEIDPNEGVVNPTTLVDGENTITISELEPSTATLVRMAVETAGGIATGNVNFITTNEGK